MEELERADALIGEAIVILDAFQLSLPATYAEMARTLLRDVLARS